MSVEPPPVPGSSSVVRLRPTRAAFDTYAASKGTLSTMSAKGFGCHSRCMWHPAACAPPSRHAATRCLSGCNVLMVFDRTYQSISVSRGTMFGFSPPFKKMPWMRSVGMMCWRNAATFMYPRTAASSAFRPLCGATAAWAASPTYFTSACWIAIAFIRARSVSYGWTIIAACTPSNAPRRAISIFPPPPSSAGVPIKRSRPPASSANGASARPAPSPAAAMML